MPINGSDKFRFVLTDADASNPREGNPEIVDFSFDFTALYEIDEGIATVHVFTDGSKAKKFHYIDMEWIIDFSGVLSIADGMKLQKVKNAEIQGRKLWLFPHLNVSSRYFLVQIIEDKRQLGEYYNEEHEGPNKDYVMMFENVLPITEYNWVDPAELAHTYGGRVAPHALKGELQTE